MVHMVVVFSCQGLVFTEGISPEKGLRLQRKDNRVEVGKRCISGAEKVK